MADNKSKVPTDTKKNNEICNICNIPLLDNMTMQEHITTKQHDQRYKTVKKNERSGLYIRGYGQQVNKDKILSLFARYGTIVWAHFGYDFLLLDYNDKKAMKTALSKPHYIGGVRLLVKQKENRDNNPQIENKEDDSDIVIRKLKNVTTFNEQFYILVSHLQPDLQGQYTKCHQVCQDMLQALYQSFPYCRVHPFGSTITGLSFKQSDLDVYISEINSDQDVRYLYKIRNALHNSQYFSRGAVIANAKIPILKCFHFKTRMHCDINIRNMLGVCNSKLINYYMSINPKIKTVLLVLKFWAKVHKLTGQNHLFTNYSITLMLIFVLQHPPYNLPSVKTLQENVRHHNYQSGWNGGFQELRVQCSQLYTDTALKILMRFFDFYTDFSYGVDIICPYMGRPLKKEQFYSMAAVPKWYHNYKYVVQETECGPLKTQTAICIQDPFEHNRNNTPIVSGNTLTAFVNLCQYARGICIESEDNFLYKLFTQEPLDFRPQLASGSVAREFVIPMDISLGYLHRKLEIGSENKKRVVIFNMWTDVVNTFMKSCLKDILGFELNEVDSTTSHKNMRKEGQTDIHDQCGQFRYKCTAMLNMWQGRKTSVQLPDHLATATFLEKQLAITQMMLELYKNIKPVESILEFEILLTPREEPPRVLVELKEIKSYKKTFKNFVSYFPTNFLSWFSIYEKELNQE